MRLRLIIPFTFVFLLAACSAASPQAAPTKMAESPLMPQYYVPTRTPTETPIPPSPTVPPTPLPSATPTLTPCPLGSWCPLPDAPIPSKDGELQLELIGNKNTWLWTESGGLTTLTESGDGFDYSPAHWIGFSDDGAYVAWTVIQPQDQVELWARRLPDGESRRLIDPPWFSNMGKHPTKTVIPMDLHWVPGTHTIGFHTNLEIGRAHV
jgi:hypothetical protein